MKNTRKIISYIVLLGAFALVGCTAKSTTDITVETPANTETQTTETTPTETPEKTTPKKQEIKPEKTPETKPVDENQASAEVTEDSTKEIDDIINSILGE